MAFLMDAGSGDSWHVPRQMTQAQPRWLRLDSSVLRSSLRRLFLLVLGIGLQHEVAHALLDRHLEGRPLLRAVPRAVDDIDAYEWNDGEVIGGMVLGWNFGDGHLNGTQLLEAVQQQCDFAPGEVRVVMVESQPLFGPTMRWRIVDAATGTLEEGETEIAPARALQPWDFAKV